MHARESRWKDEGPLGSYCTFEGKRQGGGGGGGGGGAKVAAKLLALKVREDRHGWA